MTSVDGRTGRNCTACGRPIPWDVSFCPHCGWSFVQQSPLGQAAPPTAAPKGMSTGAIVAIVVTVLIVVLVILAVVFFGFTRSSATLHIYVTSTHLLYTVSYNLYVDGSLVDSDTLGALDTVHYTYTYRWSSSDPTSVTVSATSTGGGFGSQSDSRFITVSDGGSFTINLYV